LYAKLFPTRVRAFVLDSPVYLGDASYPDDVRDAIVAYDSELTRFLAWCATSDRCGLGTTEADVGVNYDGLRETLTEGVRYNEYRLTEAALDSTATGLLMYGEWDTFASLLGSASRGDWGPLVAITAGESSDPDADHAMLQANIVVRALDYGCPKDYSPEQAFDAIEEASSAHPRIADVYSWSFTFCLGWRTQASEARLPVSDLSSAPLLLVTSAHDAATPLTGAQNLLQQVNNASQLFVVEKEGHGVIGTDDDGTQAGISFIQSGKFDSCSGFDCLNLEQRSLSNVRSPNPLRPKRPWLRPLPIRPILRGGPRL
jgi:pimeloyl-ACP methyl ester carboxylesterase